MEFDLTSATVPAVQREVGELKRSPRLGRPTTPTVAWTPSGELERRDWLEAGRRIGEISRCSQWWVGDWLRYGNRRWGDGYTEAAKITGYDPATLRNLAWVASQVDLSLRSDKLTWSHHALVAPLEPEDQRHWLALAERERMSVADLRIELRAAERGERDAGEDVAEPQLDAMDGQEGLICPHCGHIVPLPAGGMAPSQSQTSPRMSDEMDLTTGYVDEAGVSRPLL